MKLSVLRGAPLTRQADIELLPVVGQIILAEGTAPDSGAVLLFGYNERVNALSLTSPFPSAKDCPVLPGMSVKWGYNRE